MGPIPIIEKCPSASSPSTSPTPLGLPLHDSDRSYAPVAPGDHPSLGNGVLGADPYHPEIVVAANGGSDLIYLPITTRSWLRAWFKPWNSKTTSAGFSSTTHSVKSTARCRSVPSISRAPPSCPRPPSW